MKVEAVFSSFLNHKANEFVSAPTELTPHSDIQRPADTNQ